jgi:hypothetical protein
MQQRGRSRPPFRWDEERCFHLRWERDAAFYYLNLGSEKEWRLQHESLIRYFSTPRDAVAYIMDTFPIVRRKDEEKHGEYRTKRVILEIYDEMAETMRTGKPYKIRLDPSPGLPADEKGNFLLLPEWNPGQPKHPSWPPHIHPPKGAMNTRSR